MSVGNGADGCSERCDALKLSNCRGVEVNTGSVIEASGRECPVISAKGYPRVTRIIEATKSDKDKEKIIFWRRKGNNAKALENGTNFHSAIAHFLLSGTNPIFASDVETNRWLNALTPLEIIKSDILCVETEVWSDKYEYAGRLDCLAWENDELILIDWKTSATPKRKSYIEDYFLQGTAYALASYECGIAPQMPKEIRIYLFSPKKCQKFSRSLGFELVLAWLQRLKLFKQLSS